MSAKKRLDHLRDTAEEITLKNSSRIIIMSDCHRGDGSLSDDFSDNSALFQTALNYYYLNGYTYIELGDGDELWKNKSMDTIFEVHNDTFELLSRFDKACRLYMIFGNHDAVKQKSKWFVRYFHAPDFPNLNIHQALLLRLKTSDDAILLLHGHQVDFFNHRLWRLACFLVRHLWRPLELIGVHDPTSASANHSKLNTVERELSEWAQREKQMVIAGHTHRVVFPGDSRYENALQGNSSEGTNQSFYYNDGCCIHPHKITGIEISDCKISLIAWSYKVRENGTVYVGREILSGPRKLKDCFPTSALPSAYENLAET